MSKVGLGVDLPDPLAHTRRVRAKYPRDSGYGIDGLVVTRMATRRTVTAKSAIQPNSRTRDPGDVCVRGVLPKSPGHLVVSEPSSSGNHTHASGSAIVRHAPRKPSRPAPMADRASQPTATTPDRIRFQSAGYFLAGWLWKLSHSSFMVRTSRPFTNVCTALLVRRRAKRRYRGRRLLQ
jgi:hypothetical protein